MVGLRILLSMGRGVSREGLRGLEHPPSLPDFTEILPISVGVMVICNCN